ncbi:MAG: tetratricopeptide repeat protein [Neptuniibacter sp.]
MSTSEKLDTIIYLLVTLILIVVIKTLITAFYRRISGNSQREVLNVLIDKGEYDFALKKCNRVLKKRPQDSYFLWMKANILFKLNSLGEARELFQKLSEDEPLWKEDAEKFLNAINEKT